MRRVQLLYRPVDSTPIHTPNSDTHSIMANALLMGGTNRLVRHGKTPIAVRHVLDLLLGQVFARGDTEFRVHTITATELYRQFGVARYPSPVEIERLVQQIAEFTTVARIERKLISVHWIERAIYDKATATFSFKLSEQLRPFVLGLRGDFTQLCVRDLLRLKSGYSHQLYQIASRFEPLSRRTHRIPLDRFCDALHLPTDHMARTDWRKLSERILRPAQQEVWQKTGLSFCIRPVRVHGRARGPVDAIELSTFSYERVAEPKEKPKQRRDYSKMTQQRLARLVENVESDDAGPEGHGIEGIDFHSDPYADDV